MNLIASIRKLFLKECGERKTSQILDLLSHYISFESNKKKELIALQSRLTRLNDNIRKDVLSWEQINQEENKIFHGILGFIDTLEMEDFISTKLPIKTKDFDKLFVKQATPTQGKKGKVLYRIPSLMGLEKSHECIIVIGLNKKELKTKHKKTTRDKESKIVSIRTSDLMEAHLLNEKSQEIFTINSPNRTAQIVDSREPTKWIFSVKPLKKGDYKLLVKIAVSEKVEGEKAYKEFVVAKKPIKIVDADHYQQEVSSGNPFDRRHALNVANLPSLTFDGFEIADATITVDAPLLPVSPDVISPSVDWLGITDNIIQILVGIWIASLPFFPTSPSIPVSPHELGLIYELTDDSLMVNVTGNKPPFDLFLASVGEEEYFDSMRLDHASNRNYSLDFLNQQPSDYVLLQDIMSRANTFLHKNYLSRLLKSKYKDKTLVSNSTQKKSLDSYTTTYTSYDTQLVKNLFVIDSLGKRKDTLVTLLRKISIPTELIVPDRKKDIEEQKEQEQKKKQEEEQKEQEQKKKQEEEEQKKKPAFLYVNSSYDRAHKKLLVTVEGNESPFKVFIDGKKEATLTKPGIHPKDYSSKYSDCDNMTQQVLKIEVIDAKKNKEVIEEIIGDLCEAPSLLTVKNCFYFDQFKGCSILYLFTQGSRAHFKMRTQTFRNCEFTCKVESFNIYELDISEIASTCENKALKNLPEVTTFIYNGSKAEPQRFDGYVSPEELIQYLNCHTDQGARVFSYPIKKNITYQYQGEHAVEGLIIQSVAEEYRVKIASFREPNNFKKFLKTLEQLSLGYSIFVRYDGIYSRVYLGGFQSSEAAILLTKKIKASEILSPILGEEKAEQIVEAKI